jgi:hypothetical protein
LPHFPFLNLDFGIIRLYLRGLKQVLQGCRFLGDKIENDQRLRNRTMTRRLQRVVHLGFTALLCWLSTSMLLHAQGTRGKSGGPEFASLAAVAPVMDCTKLTALDISDAVEYPTHITSAKAVQEGQRLLKCWSS